MTNVKLNRLLLEITQRELAIKLSSVRTVQDWEQGRYSPGKIRGEKLDNLFCDSTITTEGTTP